MNCFDFVRDDRGQHCAISVLGVWFQKNNLGINKGLSVKNHVIDIFFGMLLLVFLIFCMRHLYLILHSVGLYLHAKIN